jgi:predicted SnoaL-like aldol condensation-catalyzing enzyme
MTPLENKRTVTRLYEELFGAGRLELADELMAVDYVNHKDAPGAGIGRDGVRAAVAGLHQRCPDGGRG